MTMSRIIDGINPPPPISTPKEAPWKEVEALAAQLADLSLKLSQLIALMGGAPGGGTTPVAVVTPHKNTIITGFQQVYVPGTAQNLYPVPIPDGYPVTIVANPSNTGNIYIGKTQSEAQDPRVRMNGLAPGLAVSLKIKNLGVIWVDADVANEGVSWLVESDT